MSEKDWTTCPICGDRVLVRNVEKHRRKVHPDGSSDTYQEVARRPPVEEPSNRTNDGQKVRASPVSRVYRETGVRYDDESFLVLFEGRLIATAQSMEQGRSILETHKKAQQNGMK